MSRREHANVKAVSPRGRGLRAFLRRRPTGSNRSPIRGGGIRAAHLWIGLAIAAVVGAACDREADAPAPSEAPPSAATTSSPGPDGPPPSEEARLPMPSVEPSVAWAAGERLTTSAVPADTPLLIHLHGYGSNARDLGRMAEVLAPGTPSVGLQGPLEMGQGRWAWMERGVVPPVDARRSLVHAVMRTADDLEAPPDRRVLLGFSQGGMMALETVAQTPEGVCAVVSIGGRLLDSEAPVAPGEVQVFIAHGMADPIVPLQDAAVADRVLRAAGHRVTYESYPGVRHHTTKEMLADITAWLATTGCLDPS